MSTMPHHAVDLDEDDQPTSRFNGHMPGAQPLEPDSRRELANVLRDYAAAAWGELRGIDKLDSAKAQRVLAEYMGRLVSGIKLQDAVPAKGLNRTDEFKDTAIKLRAALMKTWGVPKKAGEVSLGSQKTCRVCGQLKGFHKPSCEVGIAVEAARKSGIMS